MRSSTILVLLLLAGVTFSPAVAVERSKVVLKEEFVAKKFSKFSHAPTIVETHKSGRVVVGWFGGSKEGENDVSIWVVSKDKGAAGWSKPHELDNGDGKPCWNVVMVDPRSGPLLAYFKIGDSVQDWQGYVRTSDDEGTTWSKRRTLPKSSAPVHKYTHGRFLGPTKNPPLELPDGRLLCGSSTEADGWRVHMEIAGPGDYIGKFAMGASLAGEAIQPTFLIHSDDYKELQTICRHHTPGDVNPPLTARSHDMGKTWGPLVKMGGLTSVSPSGLDGLTITNLNAEANRWFVLAYARGDDQQRLAIAISRDGVKWTEVFPEFDFAGEKSEMEYPTIIQTQDKLIHMVYAWGHSAKIKHVVLDPWVLTGEKK